MPFFKTNWNLEGVGDKLLGPGEVIEAEFSEVEHLVAAEFGGLVKETPHAVLTPVEPDEATAAALAGTSTVPGGDVDLEKLKKADLIAHAAEHHDLELDPTLKKEDLVAKIEEARAATPPVETPAS